MALSAHALGVSARHTRTAEGATHAVPLARPWSVASRWRHAHERPPARRAARAPAGQAPGAAGRRSRRAGRRPGALVVEGGPSSTRGASPCLAPGHAECPGRLSRMALAHAGAARPGEPVPGGGPRLAGRRRAVAASRATATGEAGGTGPRRRVVGSGRARRSGLALTTHGQCYSTWAGVSPRPAIGAVLRAPVGTRGPPPRGRGGGRSPPGARCACPRPTRHGRCPGAVHGTSFGVGVRGVGAGSGCTAHSHPRRSRPEPRTGADRAKGRRCFTCICCGAAAQRGR